MIFFQVYFRSSTASSGQRLLDFGCGDGGYLWRAKKRRLDCVGYEPESGQATAVEKRHGIPVYSDMQKLKAAVGEGFDYITLHFVFEHLDKPSDTMRQLADMLKPGGVIYMTVPALNSWEATFFGRRWSGLDPPDTLHFIIRHILNGWPGNAAYACSGTSVFILQTVWPAAYQCGGG